MKTIGLLGGTQWASTISYYTKINEMVADRLGENHSAKLILRTIDSHDVISSYGSDDDKIAYIVHMELLDMYALQPDCLIICCNDLHRYYEMVKYDIYDTEDTPLFHAAELTGQEAQTKGYRTMLLLATQPTMNDGWFADIIEKQGIRVVVPAPEERNEMERILSEELMHNQITQYAPDYFTQLIAEYSDCDAVILGRADFSLFINTKNSELPIINPAELQIIAAVDYALRGMEKQ